MVKSISITPCDWSDHHIITFHIPSAKKKTYLQQIKPRHWIRDTKNLNWNNLASHCEKVLTPPNNLSDDSDLTAHYNSTMTKLFDQVASPKLKRIPDKDKNPWFSGALNEERRKLRLTERKWRQHPSSLQLKLLRKSRNSNNKSILQSKKDFFRSELDNAKNRPKKLFEMLKQQSNKLAKTALMTLKSQLSSEEFSSFFTAKTSFLQHELRTAANNSATLKNTKVENPFQLDLPLHINNSH